MKAFVVEQPRAGSLRALNYSPAIERIRLTGSSSARPLGKLAASFGRAYGTVFTRLDCHRDHGVRLLSQTDTFAAEPLGRIIRKDSMPHADRHLVRRWQILISGAGQMAEGNLFGRSIIADARIEGCFIGPDTFAIEFEEPGSDLNLWTYAVLNSTFGLQGIRAAAYGTSIPHLRADFLAALPIPEAPKEIVRRVAKLIRQTVSYRESYLLELMRARAIVDSMPTVQSANELCADRKMRAAMWEGPFPTLSAWTFASTGGALQHLRASWHAELGDVVEHNGIFNGPRFARIECLPPHGIEFMSQRDVMLIRPAPRHIALPGFDDRLLFADEGTILVGAQGTLGEGEIFGRAMLVHGRYLRAAFTQHLLRVVPKPSKAHALYAYLTTTVGLRLLRATAVGTKLLSMREDLLRLLPVPDWPAGIEQQVASLVSSAFHYRDLAERAEGEAIGIVEQEVIPEWLA
jgi:hypothetical protein